ncbi:NAD(P)H-binding protein [Cohnella cholangitidis]|uniref:SDR family NAD(P)-dependent oxidoreductase n=1 Tax=Cohnella cholangitidis TaxID=2598458 RepID=A0A7G5BZS6_9BACL|nr:NAD(P)H-binding protein [Cohnella cholangitidis]QMV42460.1 SDR family NAD(P)-dependent oxidoreductase [Cohnella cholangitidis]
MRIVMTGATGNLGRLIANELLNRMRAEDLILSVRRPDAVEVEPFRRQGAEVRYGDYDNPKSLREAFSGASRLLLVSSSHSDDTVRLKQHAAAIEAAAETGIEHLFYTSFAYAEKGRLPLHAMHLQTEQAIRASGLSYTILRNATYTDVLRFLGLREAVSSGILLSPPGDWTFNAASREDLAAAAATVLTEDGHENRMYELTASRAWNLGDLARALSEASGRRVVHRADPSMNNPLYGMLPLSDTRSVSPDLARLVGYPLQSLKDEVRKLLESKMIG